MALQACSRQLLRAAKTMTESRAMCAHMGTFNKSANDLRVRDLLEMDGSLWEAELKEIGGNRNKNQRFRSTEDVTAAELDSYQFYTLLYMDGGNMVLMHEETFEQTEIPGDMVGAAAPYLSDGMRMRVEFYNGEPLQVKPPAAAEFTVAEAQSVRSDTVNPTSFKSVTLNNGERLMVPPFVNEGDIVSVNMDTLEYAERVKKA